MELKELVIQNQWWKEKTAIAQDYDIIKWAEKKHRWSPALIENILLDPFAMHIVLGPRQAGKTTAMKLLIKKLLEIRDPKSLFYFNCENVSDHKELLDILSSYLDWREKEAIKKSIIILDEITAPKEWYRAVKGLIDNGLLQHDVVILTGSSSIAVKREVELFPGRRGKGKDFVLHPLSFRDFVEVFDASLIKKIEPVRELKNIENGAQKALLYQKELDKYLSLYMEYGGYPLSIAAVNESKEDAKKTYLSWIKNAILKAERSDVLAKQIIKVLVEIAQSDISWEGIAKKIDIKSPKTVAAYIDLLQSLFVVSVLYNINISDKKIQFGRNKKIHFRDPLLLEIAEEWGFVHPINKEGALAELLVVEHLVRKYPEHVFFWRNGSEIDAVVEEKTGLFGFEVKWANTPTAKLPNQLKNFMIISKRTYERKPLTVPLSVFLSVLKV